MNDHSITFTYLNIRQSIAILLAKIILTDIILGFIVIGIYWVITIGENYFQALSEYRDLFLIIFAINGLIKIFLSTFIILQWLNEYYEITPEYIYHKKGIIFRKIEQYRIDHIRRMEIQDSFLGEIFNFATISLFDIRLNKYLDLYLIHNPKRYAHILKEIQPEIEVEKDRVRLPFIPKEEDDIENIK